MWEKPAPSVRTEDPLGPVSVRQLRQRQAQDVDVVGGGVGPGVTRPQHPGQRLIRVVAEGEQRMVAIPALEVPGRVLLLRVHLEQGGVQVDHRIVQVLPTGLAGGSCRPVISPRASHARSRAAARATRRPASRAVVDRVQHPPRRRRRRDRPVQAGLIAQRGDVPDRLPTVGEHHRQIHQHLTRIVPTGTAPGRCPSRPRTPPATRSGRPTPAAAPSPHATPHRCHPRVTRGYTRAVVAFTPKVPPCAVTLQPSTSPESLTERALSPFSQSRHADDHEALGLVLQP